MVKRISGLLLSFLFVSALFSQSIFASGNVSSGFAAASTTDWAFYFSDQYMWKVSLYAAKNSDTKVTDTENGHVNMANFDDHYYKIGDSPMYLIPDKSPSTAPWVAGQRPNNVQEIYMSRSEGKLDTIRKYNAGGKGAVPEVPFTTYANTPLTAMPDLPYVPNLSDGNIYDNGDIWPETVGDINKVRTYFENPNIIRTIGNAYATRAGTTMEGLIAGKEFTIEGVTKTDWDPTTILPYAINGNSVNCVGWLLVYEPVAIVWVKDTYSVETSWDTKNGGYVGYGLTATDFSVSQLKRQIDWTYNVTYWSEWAGNMPDEFAANDEKKHVMRLSNLLLGNATFLEKSWFGLATHGGIDGNAEPITASRWLNPDQLLCGGVGMLQIKTPEQFTKPSSYEFRPDTDVIVGCPVYMNQNSTEQLKSSPPINADMKFTFHYKDADTGVDKSVDVFDSFTGPSGSATQSFVKWHTPNYDVTTGLTCEVTVRNYPNATVDNGMKSTIININIVPLVENLPPDPKVTDTVNTFSYTDMGDAFTPPADPASGNIPDSEKPVPKVAKITQVTRTSSDTVYLGQSVTYEVVTNAATETLRFKDGDEPTRGLTPDKVGADILKKYEKDEAHDRIVWTLEFVPKKHDSNKYLLTPTTTETGEGVPQSIDVFVSLDIDNPIIFTVGLETNKPIYRLFSDIVSTPIKHTVTFQTDGGQAIDNQLVEQGKKVSDPGILTKEGYVFKGWFTSENFAEEWDFATRSVGKTMTLYAKWEVQLFDVTFEGNGATIDPAIVTVRYGESVDEPQGFGRDHYTFGGWFSNATLTEPYRFNSDAIKSNVTVYAKWVPDKYTIMFEENGGSAIGDLSVGYDTLAIEPNVPERVGYIFRGWYKDSGLTKPFDWLSERVLSNFNLYAKWELNAYQVTFEGLNHQVISTLLSVNHNTNIAKPTDPVLTGYHFDGWYRDSLFSTPFDFTTEKITSNTSVYVKFTPNTVTFSFDSNGGSVVPDYVGVTNQLIVPSEMPEPFKDGCVFDGWCLTSNCSDEPVVTYPERFPDTNRHYYAKWAPSMCNVIFKENGGSAPANITNINAGEKIVEPVSVRTGYMLDGWFREATFETVWDFDDDVVVDNVTELFAKWTPINYTINYDSEGTVVESVVSSFGSSLTEPSVSLTGYAVAGWYTDSGFTNAWDFDNDVVSGDQTLYVKWRPSLESYSWTDIKNMSINGTAKTNLRVGDEKSVVIDGVTYVCQIYGFSHDITSDGSGIDGKAGITFGLKGLLDNNQKINNSSTNTGGWSASELRAYLNGATFTSLLPADLLSGIVSVDKQSSGGNDKQEVVVSSDKAFLFSDEEVGVGHEFETDSSYNEGFVYAIFDNGASPIKQDNTTTTGAYALRSAKHSTMDEFLNIGVDGMLGSEKADVNQGITFGFCF